MNSSRAVHLAGQNSAMPRRVCSSTATFFGVMGGETLTACSDPDVNTSSARPETIARMAFTWSVSMVIMSPSSSRAVPRSRLKNSATLLKAKVAGRLRNPPIHSRPWWKVPQAGQPRVVDMTGSRASHPSVAAVDRKSTMTVTVTLVELVKPVMRARPSPRSPTRPMRLEERATAERDACPFGGRLMLPAKDRPAKA